MPEELSQPSALISIVINNYNYGAFVADSIRSALGQTYPHVEVIVVDDGSTDASRDIIASFDTAITPVFKANGGQASACNAGFSHARGDVVMFLDSDDMLHPHCCETIVRSGLFDGDILDNDIVKINFGLDLIDSAGSKIGPCYASFPLPQGDFRESLLASGFMPTMPMSGNAFARRFLERIMPIPEKEYIQSADVCINNCIALYGKVGAIDQVLGSYRRHTSNASAQMRGKSVNLARMKWRLDREASTDRVLHDRANKLSLRYNRGALVETPTYFQLTMIYTKLSGQRGLRPAFAKLVGSMKRYGIAGWKMALIGTFMLAFSIAPRPLAHRMVVRSIGTGLLFDRLG